MSTVRLTCLVAFTIGLLMRTYMIQWTNPDCLANVEQLTALHLWLPKKMFMYSNLGCFFTHGSYQFFLKTRQWAVLVFVPKLGFLVCFRSPEDGIASIILVNTPLLMYKFPQLAWKEWNPRDLCQYVSGQFQNKILGLYGDLRWNSQYTYGFKLKPGILPVVLLYSDCIC